MKILSLLLQLIVNIMVGFLKRVQDLYMRCAFGKDPKVLKKSFYELVDKDMNRNPVPMSNFKGSVLLVTNVASK